MDNSTTPTNPTDGQAPMPSADGGMGAPAPVQPDTGMTPGAMPSEPAMPTIPTDGQAPMPSADGGMGAPAPVAGGDATPAPAPETPPSSGDMTPPAPMA